MDGFTALYYSLTTQATLGYGDIVPVSPTARLLAMSQAVGGVFYMTLLVAHLVGVYSSQSRPADPPPAGTHRRRLHAETVARFRLRTRR